MPIHTDQGTALFMQIDTETFLGLSYMSIASSGFSLPQNAPCLGQAGTRSAQPGDGIATEGCGMGLSSDLCPWKMRNRKIKAQR